MVVCAWSFASGRSSSSRSVFGRSFGWRNGLVSTSVVVLISWRVVEARVIAIETSTGREKKHASTVKPVRLHPLAYTLAKKEGSPTPRYTRLPSSPLLRFFAFYSIRSLFSPPSQRLLLFHARSRSCAMLPADSAVFGPARLGSTSFLLRCDSQWSANLLVFYLSDHPGLHKGRRRRVIVHFARECVTFRILD